MQSKSLEMESGSLQAEKHKIDDMTQILNPLVPLVAVVVQPLRAQSKPKLLPSACCNQIKSHGLPA